MTMDSSSLLARRLGGAALVTIAVACFAGPVAAMPILSEVYYDAPGTDDGQLFVEIAGAPGTRLDGLVIEGVNGSNGAVTHSIPLLGAIGANGLFVLADGTSEGTTNVVLADQIANFDFQNGPDSVVLRDGASVLDALGYGDFGPDDVFAGEGLSTPDVAAGWSLARLFADVDTHDNAADFVALATPTPGTADFAVVPEPGTAMLLGLGLASLAGVRDSRASRESDRGSL